MRLAFSVTLMLLYNIQSRPDDEKQIYFSWESRKMYVKLTANLNLVVYDKQIKWITIATMN